MGYTLKGALRVLVSFSQSIPSSGCSQILLCLLPPARQKGLYTSRSSVLGAGTLLGSVIKMKFTAGTLAEASEQAHPQPGARRDGPIGDGQHFGNWWNWRAAAVAVSPRDGERSLAKLKIPFLPRCAGSRVGPAPSAKTIPLIAVETAALETSCDQILCSRTGKYASVSICLPGHGGKGEQGRERRRLCVDFEVKKR